MSSTCDHPPWQKCLKCLGVKKEDIAKIKPKCTHDPSTKCPNCASSTDVSEFKHVPFEFYFGELRKKCKGTHPPSAKCQNCMPPQEYFYRIKEGCPNHKKYPDGICNKCMPQAAVISRQKFRHVDYVSFMNKEELQQFYNIYDKNKFLKQQMAFLYGYYSEDPTYPDGVRVNVEALYMPRQVGNDSTIELKPDEFQASADKVAEGLSLEKVGVIFTSSFSDVEFLSTEQIIESAKYQEAHKYEHPIGMHVSKWITAILKYKGGKEFGIETYMVSDQCQALVRDEVIEPHPVDKTKILKRKPRVDQIVPSIIVESKDVTEFSNIFFLISIQNGFPLEKKRDHQYLKFYDFPIDNTSANSTTEIQKFRVKRRDPPSDIYSDFHFLLACYLTNKDKDSVLKVANAIANDQKPMDIKFS